MKRNRRTFCLLAVALCVCLQGCDRAPSGGEAQSAGEPPGETTDQYRVRVRNLYNRSQFDALEAIANDARATKAHFANGSWKLFQIYNCLGCRDEEPEEMWQLHDRIHKAWIAAKPNSITARVAHADFFTTYAWHARGNDYADKVTPEGWRQFEERLQQARETLEKARELQPKCPMWWRVQMTVALGQSWSRADYDALFDEAKKFEPTFWSYDLARANYLLPRWHGKPGEWEAAAEAEAQRPDGLGWETYARVVAAQRGYYADIFRNTKASWPRTREGFELMRQRYPDDFGIPSTYCRLACVAEDQDTAKKLFTELGTRMQAGPWGDARALARDRAWALQK